MAQSVVFVLGGSDHCHGRRRSVGGVGIALALALGLTIASFASLMQTLAVEAVAPRLAGSAMGYSLVGTALGGMVGPPLFGAVVDLTGNFANGWLLTAGLVLVGTFLLGFWFRERRYSRDSLSNQ